MKNRGKSFRLLGVILALTILLTGCSILRPEPVTPSSPIRLEILFDPDTPGNVSFIWSPEAAGLMDVTVTSLNPVSPELIVKIRPQLVQAN